ncbi:hypothetical protein E4U43_005293 [Claviceps pusilla]|uniref:Uncharacterized protein n=1 Tax=Claviceps pusilla TaxID=123648 RepID=A0A9P7N4E0_9HYPO|nr:hypothetical protein E4U43_005293 [Claviceps pusilla]
MKALVDQSHQSFVQFIISLSAEKAVIARFIARLNPSASRVRVCRSSSSFSLTSLRARDLDRKEVEIVVTRAEDLHLPPLAALGIRARDGKRAFAVGKRPGLDPSWEVEVREIIASRGVTTIRGRTVFVSTRAMKMPSHTRAQQMTTYDVIQQYPEAPSAAG